MVLGVLVRLFTYLHVSSATSMSCESHCATFTSSVLLVSLFDIWRLRLGAVLRRATCMPLSRPRVFRSASLGSSPPAVEDSWYSRHVCYRVLSLFHSSRGSVRYRVPTDIHLLAFPCVSVSLCSSRGLAFPMCPEPFNLSTFQPLQGRPKRPRQLVPSWRLILTSCGEVSPAACPFKNLF